MARTLFIELPRTWMGLPRWTYPLITSYRAVWMAEFDYTKRPTPFEGCDSRRTVPDMDGDALRASPRLDSEGAAQDDDASAAGALARNPQ